MEYCEGCKTSKLCLEFMGYNAKGNPKKFKTCNNCRQRSLKNSKKRSLESDNIQSNDWNEVIDIELLSEVVMTLLESMPQELHLN
ncbi:29183_t:CDS:1, partial [Racocetra persica]